MSADSIVSDVSAIADVRAYWNAHIHDLEITRHPVGSGSAWYLSAMLEHDSMLPVFRDVLRTAGLPARDHVDVEAEAVTRTDGTTDYTFYLNHGRSPVSFALAGPATDLLTGIRHSDRLDLDRYGVVVLAAPRAETTPFSAIIPN